MAEIVEVVESFAADTSGLTDGTHKSSRAKRAFANAWAPWVQKGWVYVKRDQPWTEELLTEADNFPDGRFDDIIDAISGAPSSCSLGPAAGSGIKWPRRQTRSTAGGSDAPQRRRAPDFSEALRGSTGCRLDETHRSRPNVDGQGDSRWARVVQS
ncbi:MAG: hypothetical protein SangKO_075590 [Sandaracinaceae bacterium]